MSIFWFIKFWIWLYIHFHLSLKSVYVWIFFVYRIRNLIKCQIFLASHCDIWFLFVLNRFWNLVYLAVHQVLKSGNYTPSNKPDLLFRFTSHLPNFFIRLVLSNYVIKFVIIKMFKWEKGKKLEVQEGKRRVQEEAPETYWTGPIQPWNFEGRNQRAWSSNSRQNSHKEFVQFCIVLELHYS